MKKPDPTLTSALIAASGQFREIREQRDELLEACKHLLNDIEYCIEYPENHDTGNARSAIARAEKNR